MWLWKNSLTKTRRHITVTVFGYVPFAVYIFLSKYCKPLGAFIGRPPWWYCLLIHIIFDVMKNVYSILHAMRAIVYVAHERTGEHGSSIHYFGNCISFIQFVFIINFLPLLGGRPMTAPTNLCEQLQCYAREQWALQLTKLILLRDISCPSFCGCRS